MLKSRDGAKDGKDPIVTDKRKRDLAMYEIAHPPTVGDTFYCMTFLVNITNNTILL